MEMKGAFTVITGTLVRQRNIFGDQFYELLRFFSSDFADLRQEKMTGKGTRSNENKGHAHSLTRTVRHRPLRGPIKINVSVSVSVHMESCTVDFYFLDFYRSRFRIRTNGIDPSVDFRRFSSFAVSDQG